MRQRHSRLEASRATLPVSLQIGAVTGIPSLSPPNPPPTPTPPPAPTSPPTPPAPGARCPAGLCRPIGIERLCLGQRYSLDTSSITTPRCNLGELRLHQLRVHWICVSARLGPYRAIPATTHARRAQNDGRIWRVQTVCRHSTVFACEPAVSRVSRSQPMPSRNAQRPRRARFAGE